MEFAVKKNGEIIIRNRKFKNLASCFVKLNGR